MRTEASARGPESSRRGPSKSKDRSLAPSEIGACGGLLTLVMGAVLAYGASEATTATVFVGLFALFPLILLATCDWARRDLSRLDGLAVQAGLFALLVGVVLWSLTPWGPGGAHPVWTYVTVRAGSLTVDRSALLFNVLQLFGLACVYVSGRIIGASKARGNWFLRAAVMVMGVYAIMAFIDHVSVRRAPRLAATLLSANTAATTFAASLIFAASVLANRLKRRSGLSILRSGDTQAFAALSVMAVLVTTLALTASRAGIIAATLGLCLFMAWDVLATGRKLRWPSIVLLVVAVLVVAMLATRSAGFVAERFGLAEHDAGVRMTIFAPHWEAFRSAPWTGFGLGSFVTVNQLVVTQDSLPILFNVRAAHSLYLQWLEEGGLIGAGAMLLLLGALVWPIAKGAMRSDTTGAWARAALCAMVVVLVHGATDFAMQVPAVQALATLTLGVVASMTTSRPVSREALMSGKPWPVAGFGATALLLAVLTAAPMVIQRLGGDLSSWPTASADVLADRIEAGLAHRDAAELPRLSRLSDRELALRPASGAAWLRRAAIAAAAGQREASNTALERSFAVAPLQASLFERRSVFAYERWSQLSQLAREEAGYHVKAEWRRRSNPRPFIRMANGLKDPSGRVGLALQIATLRLQYPIARSGRR